ncbi:undecaprenyl diphosphate synthase [Nitrosococcus halophilus Nc 4]|uniref:Ditrans,polycis-undecaprenyl-diphosphate synthase ((2E,6E)-farnesyl-diphosphate specific) n=1 Tax=Nitrosococcus halophilus (strain Nc4) TaxID=472759 RepID=D5BVW5_NITHN|nr:isoprenyl transferase [Nitrosococcus halophilus]ADE15544.1 undecaprenyl diphosphate synthase [Nitrosococcus halophilus Nc 4]
MDSGQVEVRSSKIPRHVAIIMDGNGRWAKQRNRPRFYGHRAGVEAVEEILQACTNAGVQVLTLFAFSSENWHRPSQEVQLLMDLFKSALSSRLDRLQEWNVRLRIIGDRNGLSEELRSEIAKAEALTATNKGITLVVAANYGGRWDITQAAKQVAVKVENKQMTSDSITPEVFAAHLSIADLPEPDLFIRTGGEQRVSNFLLWQLAYTEFYFTDILWPDFDKTAFAVAIETFLQRERRFGRTSDQVESFHRV